MDKEDRDKIIEELDKERDAFNRTIARFSKKVFKKHPKAKGMILSIITDPFNKNNFDSNTINGIMIENKNFKDVKQ